MTLLDALENQRKLLEALRSREEPCILDAIDEHLRAFETVMIGQPLNFLPLKPPTTTRAGARRGSIVAAGAGASLPAGKPSGS